MYVFKCNYRSTNGKSNALLKSTICMYFVGTKENKYGLRAFD